MAGWRCTPITFLFSGFTWLLLAALLGVATLLGVVYGTPLPKWLRAAHVHGALVGGLLQVLLGGLLAATAAHSPDKHAAQRSRTGLYILFNVATLTLIAGLSYGPAALAGAAGLVLFGTLLSVTRQAGGQGWQAVIGVRQPSWVYNVVLAALFMSLLVGVAAAFHAMPEYQAHVRLLHLHLGLLIFVTVLFMALTHELFPAAVHRELAFPSISKYATGLFLAGSAALIGGFLSSSIRLELIVGGLLAVVTGAYTVNLLRTWVASGCPASAAADHFTLAGLFLLLTTLLGTLMGANYLSDPPSFPIGSLHVIGYTHVVLLGFVTHSLCGALSYCVPAMLSIVRVPNQKKRASYRERLDSIMNRWRSIQLAGITFGTMGLGVLAAWTWSVPLGSVHVQVTSWMAIGLLLLGLGAVAIKLAWAAGTEPAE